MWWLLWLHIEEVDSSHVCFGAVHGLLIKVNDNADNDNVYFPMNNEKCSLSFRRLRPRINHNFLPWKIHNKIYPPTENNALCRT